MPKFITPFKFLNVIPATFIILLLSAASACGQAKKTDKPKVVVTDSNVTFVKDGLVIPIKGKIECGSYHTLMVRYVLPTGATTKYAKFRFFLIVDGREYKSSDINASEVGQSGTYELSVINPDKRQTSDFDNEKTEYLSNNFLCEVPNPPNKIYKLQALAKGYIKTGEKKGSDIFLKQDIISEGEISFILK